MSYRPGMDLSRRSFVQWVGAVCAAATGLIPQTLSACPPPAVVEEDPTLLNVRLDAEPGSWKLTNTRTGETIASGVIVKPPFESIEFSNVSLGSIEFQADEIIPEGQSSVTLRFDEVTSRE